MALIARAGLSYVFRELSAGIPRDTAPLGAAFRWIDDPSLFEPETSLLLKAIVLAKKPGSNYYVASSTGAGNPIFSNEKTYDSPDYPSEEIRLLAAFRFWNMVQYYFPYKDVMDHDWIDLLPELVPRFVAAANATEYHLAVAEMAASINDAHALTSSAVLSAYRGVRSAPIQARFVEGRTVITRVLSRLLDPGIDLRVGDVISHINGVPAETRRAAMRKWIQASNEASLERITHTYLVQTNDTRLTLTVQCAEAVSSTLDVNTVTLGELSNELNVPAGPTYALLPGNVGYVHMGLLQNADVADVMGRLRSTVGIVFDIRNYPNSTLYTVSNYLSSTTWAFAKFTEPDFDHPGTFGWTGLFYAGPGSSNAWSGTEPATYTYTGKIVVLVDQETQSSAEYTAMALRTAPRATVIGSQTAGADGNVSRFTLPGGITTRFSGIGVFYPDGTPTQRVGIVPDIIVKPTIQGLRDGRDEVLEAAVQFLR